jgi:GAF domain
MSEDRLRTVLERLAVHRSDLTVPLGQALCATGVDVLGIAGAGITMQAEDGAPYGLGASNAVMAELQELEHTLGEGPCVDAYVHGSPVAEPDLADPHSPRWVAFNEAALQTEARAAFGYPLRLRTARFGALNLYATTPGPLDQDQHENASVLAHVTLHAILANGGTSSDPFDELVDVSTNQIEVHQATGMLSVQLAISISEALARLRAHAFADGRPISQVASDIVTRRLRLEP